MITAEATGERSSDGTGADRQGGCGVHRGAAADGGAEPGKVAEVLDFCDTNNIKYQNSHTNVIEDNGLFSDIRPIVEMKAKLDPHNLLNRGRLRSATTRPCPSRGSTMS